MGMLESGVTEDLGPFGEPFALAFCAYGDRSGAWRQTPTPLGDIRVHVGFQSIYSTEFHVLRKNDIHIS
jgi:hypothetical protein